MVNVEFKEEDKRLKNKQEGIDVKKNGWKLRKCIIERMRLAQGEQTIVSLEEE